MGGRSGKTVVRDRAGNRILWRIFRREGRGAVAGSVKLLLAVRRLASHVLGATEGTQIEGAFSRRKIKARTFHRWFSIGVAFVPESFMRFGGG